MAVTILRKPDMIYQNPKTVAELRDLLDRLPDDMKLVSAKYNSRYGEYDLEALSVSTIFTDESGTLDMTDKERDRDIATLIFS